ncbi:MAG: aspartate/glutamate racemase family protein [bacterium]
MIGIFDSGSGGLTVLKAVREVLPTADVVYFGDIKNAPYGEKSREELSQLTIGALKVLQERGATSIISACNSVSASLTISLFDLASFAPGQLVEMVGPTAAHFKGSPARVLLCATSATISSDIYQQAFQMVGKQITTVAIPDLAGAIEFGESVEKVEAIIKKSFTSIDFKNFDVLILACTHYPLVLPVFQGVLAELIPEQKIVLFDPALAVAERAEKMYKAVETGGGQTHFLISKDSAPFRARVAELFPPFPTKSYTCTIEVL